MSGYSELKVYSISAVSNIPPFVIWGVIVVFGVGCTILVKRNGWKEGLKTGTVLLLSDWLFLILCTTLIFREALLERQCHLIPFWSYFHYPENSYFLEAASANLLNVIMFIPVGLLLGLGFRKMTWKKVFLFGLSFSFMIELLQFIFKRGLSETDDLIHNFLGCLLGHVIYRFTLRSIRYIQTLFQASV